MKASYVRLARSVPLLMSLALGAALLTLMSCTPGSEISVQESDIALTIRDPNVDFGAIVTYKMSNSIYHILDEDDPGDDISREYDDDILALIAANLDARGFQRMDENSLDSSDVRVVVSATTVANWYAYSYYPWYGGWGWYYPYYPTWGVSYAYTTGTLIVDMVNPSEADPVEQTFPNYWRGVVNGVLDDVESSKVRRFTDSINQLFIQSPYLKSAGQ